MSDTHDHHHDHGDTTHAHPHTHDSADPEHTDHDHVHADSDVVVPDALVAPGEGGDEGGFDLGALLGGGDEGGFDFGALLEQASTMQAQMAQAQAQVAEQIAEGVAGGGAVRIIVTGGMEFQAVTIQPEAVDPDDVVMLQDLILAALHDAVANVQALQAGAMGGIDLGSMGDLLGGAE